MTTLLLFLDAVLVLGLVWRIWIEQAYQKVLRTRIDIADVTFAFRIRTIRENSNSYTLSGVDGISVNISKEAFEIHQVAIDKIWVYDRENYFCLDPDYKLVFDEGVVKHD